MGLIGRIQLAVANNSPAISHIFHPFRLNIMYKANNAIAVDGISVSSMVQSPQLFG